MTTSLSRGISTSTFFRLCSRAPRTEMACEALAGARGEAPDLNLTGASESPGETGEFFLPFWPLAMLFKPEIQLLRGSPRAAIIAPAAPDQSPLFYDRSV